MMSEQDTQNAQVHLKIAIPIAGGLLLGYWIDKKLGTTPWLTLAGTVLGFIVGFYHFFKVVLYEGKKRDQ